MKTVTTILAFLLVLPALHSASVNVSGRFTISGYFNGYGIVRGKFNANSISTTLDLKMRSGPDLMRLRMRAFYRNGTVFLQHYLNGSPIAVGEGYWKYGNRVLLAKAPMTTLIADGPGTLILKLRTKTLKGEFYTPMGKLKFSTRSR